MKSRKITVTITLSEAAISALSVLSALDMRSKSQEIEYLIIEATERRKLEQEALKVTSENNTVTVKNGEHSVVPVGNYNGTHV